MKNVNTSFPILSVDISLDTQAFKDIKWKSACMRLQGSPLQCLAKRVNYMWLAQVSEKKRKRKRNIYQKTASAPPLPSLTASCFQLFSPAVQVLSGWILTRGETNKDNQDWAIKLLQYFFFFLLLGPRTPSTHLTRDLSLPITLRAASSFYELWSAPLTLPLITVSYWFLLTKPLAPYLLSSADHNCIVTKHI